MDLGMSKKGGEEWAAAGMAMVGGAYHEIFCPSDLSSERKPSSIMNIIDLGEIFIHIKWSSTRKCLSVTCRQKPLWALFQYSVLFVLLVC